MARWGEGRGGPHELDWYVLKVEDATPEPSTSFPVSLVFPPPGARGGGKMRDPGNEVAEPFVLKSDRYASCSGYQ